MHTDRHEETADAVSLTLGPANNGSVVQVRPGEYVSVRVYIPGENLVQPRQYTVTATNENSIRITVRRISARDSLPAGMVSNVLCDLAAGADGRLPPARGRRPARLHHGGHRRDALGRHAPQRGRDRVAHQRP